MALGPGTTTLLIYIPKETKQQLQQAAKHLDETDAGKVTMNSLVNLAIKELLDRLRQEKKIP